MSETWRHQGVALAVSGRVQEGAIVLAAALALDPGDLDAWSNLSAAALGLDRIETAARAAANTLRLDARQAAAWNNLGSARQRLGRRAAAISAHAVSLALDPAGAMAWLNLGVVLRQADRDFAAISVYRRALAIAPDWSLAAVNLGNALAACGATAEADRAFAAAANRGNAAALRLKRALLLPMVADSVDELLLSRARLAETIEALSASNFTLLDPLIEIGQTAFHLAYHNLPDRDLQSRLAALYLKSSPELGTVAPHAAHWPGPSSSRFRIAIVSELLHQHTIGRLFSGLIAALDRKRFEIIVVSPSRPDDAVRAAIRASADLWLALPDRLAPARALLGDLRADLILYPDIGMTPLTYFLAFARLAPLQAVHWGHPDTTGIPNLDLFLTASIMEPQNAEQDYSERLLRLPGPSLFLARPETPRVEARGGGSIYLCPQSPQKLHPDFDAAIAEILRRDERGRCLLVVGRDSFPGRRLSERLRRNAPEIADRIEMLAPMPRNDFMALLASASVMLDPFHYSGGHTSLEAFAVGTPIVTLPGRFMRGRHTYGFYRLMEINDAIAADVEDYVERAVALAKDNDRRRSLVESIERNSHALFNRRDSIDALGDQLIERLEGMRRSHRPSNPTESKI